MIMITLMIITMMIMIINTLITTTSITRDRLPAHPTTRSSDGSPRRTTRRDWHSRAAAPQYDVNTDIGTESTAGNTTSVLTLSVLKVEPNNKHLNIHKDIKRRDTHEYCLAACGGRRGRGMGSGEKIEETRTHRVCDEHIYINNTLIQETALTPSKSKQQHNKYSTNTCECVCASGGDHGSS